MMDARLILDYIKDVYDGERFIDLHIANDNTVIGFYKTFDAKYNNIHGKEESYLFPIKITLAGDIVGTEYRFKVRILNTSPFMIHDIEVSIENFPENCIKPNHLKRHADRVEPNGNFRTLTFSFAILNDCDKIPISVKVSYVNARGKQITIEPEVYHAKIEN